MLTTVLLDTELIIAEHGMEMRLHESILADFPTTFGTVITSRGLSEQRVRPIENFGFWASPKFVLRVEEQTQELASVQ